MLRKARIELEVQVKELEGRLSEREAEQEKVVEKERRKVEKLKGVLEEWHVRFWSSFSSAVAIESVLIYRYYVASDGGCEGGSRKTRDRGDGSQEAGYESAETSRETESRPRSRASKSSASFSSAT